MIKFSAIITLFVLFALIGLYSQAKTTFIVPNKKIIMDASFMGTNLFIFGKRNKGEDILIQMSGPKKIVSLIREEKQMDLFFIPKIIAHNISLPDFFFYTSSIKKQKDFMMPIIKIGKKTIKPNSTLYKVLISNLRKKGLFGNGILEASNNMLYGYIKIPKNINPGSYNIYIYTLINGEKTKKQTIKVIIVKARFYTIIMDLAKNHALLYGFMASLMSLFLGLSFSYIFRKV